MKQDVEHPYAEVIRAYAGLINMKHQLGDLPEDTARDRIDKLNEWYQYMLIKEQETMK